MAEEKIRLPTGQAGLVRYFEEFKEEVAITPEQVVGISVAIIVFFALVRVAGLA